jgi:sec-independent protein translocase protein TatA
MGSHQRWQAPFCPTPAKKEEDVPFRIGPTELIIILVIVMMIFGVGRLPQIGGSMGKAIREFRKNQENDEPSVDRVGTEEERKAL